MIGLGAFEAFSEKEVDFEPVPPDKAASQSCFEERNKHIAAELLIGTRIVLASRPVIIELTARTFQVLLDYARGDQSVRRIGGNRLATRLGRKDTIVYGPEAYSPTPW